MASVIALRALVGASLGLGALDLIWINASLAPRLVGHEATAAPEQPSAPTPSVAMEAQPSESPDSPSESPDSPSAPPSAPSEPPAPATQPTPSEPPASVETVTKRVYFDTGSAALDTRARKTIAQLAAMAGPTTEFVLEGHADYRGAESLNVMLSRDRAVAVQQQLVQLGIAPSQVHVNYAGESKATTNLQRDRRVDIQITGGRR